ncbi:unnamed protein product [Orchesella dallaii]|uniref:C2H2-type domain-containing protein n=1 Tax=Orchesella dallaii TaxID=48710 RepID=A0ABP1PQC4_9HEXA
MKVNVGEEALDDLFQRVSWNYKCRKCSIRFSSRRSLKRHAHKKHGKKKESRVSTPKVCKWEIDASGALKLKSIPEIKVVLKRQRFKEIYVTTPAEGKREIFFTCEVDSQSPKKKATEEEKKTKYEEWRLENIDVLSRDGNPKVPGKDKTLLLSIPYQKSFMFDVHGLRDDVHSILNVISGQYMTWMVLDAYLMRRIESYNSTINSGVRASYKLRPKLNTRFEYLTCRFLPVYDRDQCPSTFKINMKYLPRFPLKDCVLIAPQFTCKHFYMAVFDFSQSHIRLFDSSWHFVSKDFRIQQILPILDCLTKKLKEETRDDEGYEVPKRWKFEFVDTCAQQIDEYSCGVYAIYYTENELKGKSSKNSIKLSKKDIVKIRTNIAFELLPTTYYGRKFLEAISD